MADSKLELVIQVDSAKANASIQNINGSLANFEKQAVSTTVKASKSFDGLTASMTKGVLAGNAIYDMAKKAFQAVKSFTLGAIETQDQMGKMAQKLGLGVAELSALKHVAKLSALDVDTLGTGVGILSKNMLAAAQGSKEQRKHFASLGIEVRNSNGALRSTASVISDLADRFKAMPDGAAKTALAMQLFGRSGKELIPLLNMGGNEIRSMMEEARKLGLVIDRDTAKAAERFNDNLTRLRGAIEGLGYKTAEYLLPKLNELADKAVRWVKDGGFDKLAGQIREAAEWIKNLGMWIVSYALVSQLLKLAGAARTFAAAIGTMNVAMMANPWGLAAAGIATFGYVMWKQYDRIQQTRKELEAVNKQAAVLAALKSGQKVEDVKKSLGMTDEQIRFAIAPGQTGSLGTDEFNRFKVKGFEEFWPAEGFVPEEEEAGIDKIKKFILDANRAAREFRRSAEEALAGGAAKEIMEVQKEIEKLTIYMDESGIETKIKLSAEAQAEIHKALQLKIQKIQKDGAEKIAKDYEEAMRKRLEIDTEYFRKKLDMEESLEDAAAENARQILQYRETAAGTRRDSALRQLEGIGPQTAEQASALEARKADIEIQYLREVHEVKTQLFDSETEMILQQLNLQKEVLAAAGVNVERISGLIEDIRSQREQLRGQIDEQTAAAVDEAKENAAIRQMQLVRDEQQKTFDSFKRQAEGVFDALLTRSRSVFGAIGNAFRTAILTAIKEIVTSQAARMLMQLMGGMRISGGSPAFGGTGGLGMAGMIGGLGGGIAGISQPGAVTNASSVTGNGLGSLSGLFNLRASGGGLKDFLGIGGLKPAGGIGPTMPWGEMSLGGKLSAIGKSNAALMAGAMLGLAGLQRGGLSGLGMTTAGGAMIGFKYGGGLGAAIGASIGAAVGIARLFAKGAEAKVREKVKNTYGVDIKDKGVCRQIVEIAKSSYGGNLDMAIRTTQVQDLVRLYAMTTGQGTSGLRAQMTSSTLIQSGGSLYQQRQYINGLAVGMRGGIPVFHSGIDYVPRDMFAFLQRGERVTPAAENKKPLPGANLSRSASSGGSSNSGPIIVNVSVPGAKDFFEKETVNTVIRNPRAVQKSSMNATRSNYNRRELAALQFAPGTLTS